MPVRPCLGCNRLTADRYCPTCAAGQNTTTTGRRIVSGHERRRRASVVDAWLSHNGATCPGWRRPPHLVQASDLTADHVVAVAAGGDEHGVLTVLCRSCNSAKQDGLG